MKEIQALPRADRAGKWKYLWDKLFDDGSEGKVFELEGSDYENPLNSTVKRNNFRNAIITQSRNHNLSVSTRTVRDKPGSLFIQVHPKG